MVGLGNRRSRGSGSGSQSQYDDEDRLLTEGEVLAQWINGSLSSLPILAPDALWFDNNKVKKVVRAAIVGKFDKFAPSYTAATLEQKEDWWNRFQKKTRLLETLPEEEIDDKEVYYDAGGFNKKGKVPGLGKATPHYYDRPRPSFGDKSSTSYVPGFVSTLSKEHRAMKEQLKVMEQWKSQMEQTLAAKGIHIPTESCNPNLQAQNDRFDHGDNDGGNNEGYGGDLAYVKLQPYRQHSVVQKTCAKLSPRYSTMGLFQ